MECKNHVVSSPPIQKGEQAYAVRRRGDESLNRGIHERFPGIRIEDTTVAKSLPAITIYASSCTFPIAGTFFRSDFQWFAHNALCFSAIDLHTIRASR
jgi:hypothetical protein